MPLSIEISAEVESALARHAAEEGVDVASFIRQLLAERLSTASAVKPYHVDRAEFRQSLREIIELHTPSLAGVDDSRESIYAGRGE